MSTVLQEARALHRAHKLMHWILMQDNVPATIQQEARIGAKHFPLAGPARWIELNWDRVLDVERDGRSLEQVLDDEYPRLCSVKRTPR